MQFRLDALSLQFYPPNPQNHYDYFCLTESIFERNESTKDVRKYHFSKMQFERDKLSISTRESLDELYKRGKIEVLDSSVEAPKVEGLDVDLTVLEAMNREDIQPAERFSIIKNIEASLEQKDWEYIYEHSSDDLKAFAASKLA